MRFGDYQELCSQVPSYTWCNLFYRQIQDFQPSLLTGTSADPASAPVGVNPTCGTLRVGNDGSLGNISNVVVCAVSMLVVLGLIYLVGRRKAAVGRVEFRFLLIVYFLTLPFQLLTNGSLLEQGTTALVVLTAIHAGLVVTLFLGLLANAIVATQVVEDGTMASVIPYLLFTIIFFGGTVYVSLDIALGITKTLGPTENPSELRSIALFVLTSIWPAASALIYFVLMIYIILGVLNEIRPVWFFILAAGVFVLAQLAWFLLGKVICRRTNAKIDGSFIATFLETVCVLLLYLGWRNITEESWEDTAYN
ncbi:hypothetical protein E1B28_010472 [Marasmius oreades]|uniref:Chitin synthase export chaperone n=1 Tax=Marasmius oreades TaxID=181124 RepID=A0A9P7RX82_9AGAR|nr:uncharacterized protein E1B28_010472 [Marasmius oreades]KAG7091436.1 hypothetical protein E1B28_010472 [Marasmius oreades]